MASVSFESRSLQRPLYYGIRGGYRLERGLGFEAELIHLKAYADIPQSHRVLLPQFNMSHGANLLLGNLVMWKPLASAGRWRVTGRIGAGVTIPHVEAQVAGIRFDRYEFGGPAFQVAGGPEIRLGHGFFWTGEYKFTHGVFKVGETDTGAKTNLGTHHAVTGLLWEIPK